MAWFDLLASPLGTIVVGGSAEGLHRLEFADAPGEIDAVLGRLERDAGTPPDRDPLAAAGVVRQLEAYFAGRRLAFDLALAARGTAFQRRVWGALVTIAPGATASYGAIARQIDRPTASRAVGAANGRNPIAIVVPCHRVIGADGTLTGYAGGMERKRWLLEHEGVMLAAAVR